MKYAIILPDGAADEPVESLEGKTPLDVAVKPNIDWISTNGRQGTVVTVPPPFLPASDVATLSLLGYDPHKNYDGRAPLEAAAQGLQVQPTDLIFRCNFVTIVDGAMADFTAGHISQEEAETLIAALNAGIEVDGAQFKPGVSYRNLLIASGVADAKPICTPPHDIPNAKIEKHLPTGPGSDWTIDIMRRARAILADHEINAVRRDLGENSATDIWLWGQGRPRALTDFKTKFGLRVAVIAAVDLIRGIARSAGMSLIDVEGATGYLDTNYEGKGQAAVEALDHYDVVVVHVESPDEAGHLGDVAEKIAAIEKIDKHVVGPVLEKLREFDRWRILVAPDHPTPVERRIHTDTPPPFCMAGHAISTVLNRSFNEKWANDSDLVIDPGHELMEFFLRS